MIEPVCQPRCDERPGVIAWTLAGAAVSFSIVTGLSIGLVILPGALVAVAVALKAPREWPAAGIGAGAILLLVAWLNRGPETLRAARGS